MSPHVYFVPFLIGFLSMKTRLFNMLVVVPLIFSLVMYVSVDYLYVMDRFTNPNVTEIYVWGGIMGVLLFVLARWQLKNFVRIING